VWSCQPPTIEVVEPDRWRESQRPRSVEARLDAHAVTHDDWVRLDLYTWTTPSQIEALRTGGPLLVATEATAGRATPFNRLLRTIARERRPGHELATVLRDHPALIRRRYAWPSPFATVLGKGPRRYGEALIHVELRPEAVIARLDPSSDRPWQLRDGEGRAVELEALIADPMRLGAVYYLEVGTQQSIPFREYVLCNEAMVARFSVGTVEVRERVAAERQLVLELAEGPFAELRPGVERWRAWPQWIDPAPAPTLVSLWHRTLAFDNPRYRPTPDALRAVAQALGDYDPTAPPLRSSEGHATR